MNKSSHVFAAKTNTELRAAFRAAAKASGRQASWVVRELMAKFVQREQGPWHAAPPLAVASHELRNPLNGLLGTLNLLKDSSLSQRQSQWADTAWSTARAMLELLDDILDLSKLEAGALVLEEEEFDVRGLLEQTVEHFVHLAAERNVTLKVHVGTRLHGQVCGDRKRLRQVLLNLVHNAIKFTDKGSVSISAISTGDGMLRFDVRDSGKGIDQSHLNDIFQLSGQGDSASPRSGAGGGLGLAICKQLVNLMGGDISATSTPGQGACISFSIRARQVIPTDIAPKRGTSIGQVSGQEVEQPREERTSRTSAPVLRRKGDDQPFRILVAEDNRTNRMIVRSMLEMTGYACEAVADGPAAVAAAQRGGFDLILMDCDLPELDGYRATVRIRQHEMHHGSRTPVIAYTGNLEPGQAAKLRAAGMDDQLTKPLTLSNLQRVIDKWVHRVCESDLPANNAGGDGSDFPVIDPFSFGKLRDRCAEQLPEIVATYLEDVPVSVAEFALAVQEGNLSHAQKLAHKLAGSAHALGATRFARLCKKADILAWDGHLDQLPALVTPIRAAYNDVSDALLHIVDELKNSAQSFETQRKRILIVDDDKSSRAVTREMLRRNSFLVEEAADGAEALAALQCSRIDLVLLDALMPMMDGFTTCERMRGLVDAATIPVIMVTGLNDKGSIQRALQAGATAHVCKPIDYVALTDQIRCLVAHPDGEVDDRN